MTRHIEIHIKAMELARKREREKYRNNNNYYLKSNKKKTNKQTEKKRQKIKKKKNTKRICFIFQRKRGEKIYNNKTCSLFIHEEK